MCSIQFLPQCLCFLPGLKTPMGYASLQIFFVSRVSLQQLKEGSTSHVRRGAERTEVGVGCPCHLHSRKGTKSHTTPSNVTTSSSGPPLRHSRRWSPTGEAYGYILSIRCCEVTKLRVTVPQNGAGKSSLGEVCGRRMEQHSTHLSPTRVTETGRA